MQEELLTQILSELKTLNGRMDSIDKRLGSIEQRVGSIEQRMDSMEQRMDLIQSQVNENTQIVKVIRDRQEETDARLESMALDIHHLHGEVSSIKDQVVSLKGEVEFTYQKTSKNELDIFKLRKSISE